MNSAEPTIQSLLRATDDRTAAKVAAQISEIEDLRLANEGKGSSEIALRLAEAESTLLQMPDPDSEAMDHLAELRLSAAEDIA